MRRSACVLFVPAITALPFAQKAVAEEAVLLEEVVIEAARADLPASALPKTIQVVTGEEIARNAGGDLKSYLARRVAGFQPSNQSISSASENIRGRNIQVLINGTPRTSDLRGFSRELSLIDPDSIERVEIIKGATALYGNGAAGGLINIVTKRAEQEGLRTGAKALFSAQDEDFDDSFATEVDVFSAWRENNFGLRIDLGGVFTNDRYDGHGDQTPSDPMVGQGGGDNLENYNISGALDFRTGDHEFLVRGSGAHLTQDIDYNARYDTDPVSVDFSSPYEGRDVKDEVWNISGDYRNRNTAAGDLSLTLFYSNADRRAAFVPFGVANPLVYYSGNPANPQDPNAQSVLHTEQYGARALLANDLGFGELSLGLDYQHDRVTQNILDGREIIAPMSQDSLAFFAELDAPVTNWLDLRGGLRYEKFWLDVNDFTRPDAVQLTGFGPFILPAVDVTGGNFNYDAWVFNIGGVAHVTEELDVFAGFSQGYSIPDVGGFTRRALNANPFDTTPISFGSIRPKASKVDNYEAGVRYYGRFASIEASGFYSTSKNGTTFDSATNAVSQQKERIWGAELNAAIYPLDGLTTGVVLGYQEGKYDSDQDGDIDSYLPNNRISTPFTTTFYADYAVTNALTVGGDLRLTADRNRVSGAGIDDTFSLDLRARYDLGGAGVIIAGVDNVTDEYNLNPTATSVRNIPIASEGRRFWLGYGVEF